MFLEGSPSTSHVDCETGKLSINLHWYKLEAANPDRKVDASSDSQQGKEPKNQQQKRDIHLDNSTFAFGVHCGFSHFG